MSTLTSHNIEPIDKSKWHNLEIAGSDRIYYSRYPYKVALIDNQIRYDVGRALEIYDWIETVGRPNVKFKSAHTRHVYFKTIDLLEFFLDMFADQIKIVQGPVSNNHVNYLLQREDNIHKHQPNFKEELIIRKKKWHNKYDCKVWIGVSWNNNDYHSYMTLAKDRASQRRECCETVLDCIGDEYRLHRWSYVYCDSKHADDIQFYVKLKHKDAFVVITKALVEESM